MKNATILSIAFLVAAAVSGCLLGSAQTMSAISIKCTVVSADTGRPIDGTRVEILFAGANTGSKPMPPIVFLTDSSGVCQVEIPKKTIWISGGDAFVGGYLRRLLVTAADHEDAGVNEGFDKGALGRVSEKTFQLRRK